MALDVVYSFEKISNQLSSSLYWNGSIRFLIQQYTPIVLSSLINLQSVKFKPSYLNYNIDSV
jgi:hypothetical protein